MHAQGGGSLDISARTSQADRLPQPMPLPLPLMHIVAGSGTIWRYGRRGPEDLIHRTEVMSDLLLKNVNRDLYNRYPRLQISSFQKILLVPLEFLFRTGVTAGPSHVFPTNTTPPTYTSLIDNVFLSTFSLCQPRLSQKVRGMHSTIRL